MIGGSFQRALLCDIRIAAEGTRFTLPELTYGVIPDTGGVGRLFQMCGHGVVSDMVLTGRTMRAEEATTGGDLAGGAGRRARGHGLGMAHKVAAAPAVTVKMARRVIRHLPSEVRSSMEDELIFQTFIDKSSMTSQSSGPLTPRTGRPTYRELTRPPLRRAPTRLPAPPHPSPSQRRALVQLRPGTTGRGNG